MKPVEDPPIDFNSPPQDIIKDGILFAVLGFGVNKVIQYLEDEVLD